MTFPLILFWFNIGVILSSLIRATRLDIKTRNVPLKNWFGMYAGLPVAIYYYILNPDILYLVFGLSLCAVYWGMNRIGLFGGADSWCLMLITILMPVCPFSTIYFPGLFAFVTALVSIVSFPVIFYVKKDKNYGVPFMAIILVGFVLSLLVAFVLQSI